MYILLDIEATCWITPPRPKNQFPETIEIAALFIDRDFNLISNFQSFVLPTINPILSLSCIELTNIKQEDINNAPIFNEVMNNFYEWIPNKNCKIFSWGPFDRTQLLKEIKKKSYDSKLIEILFKQTKTVDNYFKKKYKLERSGLVNTLSFFNLESDGQPHRADGDVKNMYRIFNHCKDEIKEDIFNL